MRNLFGVNDDNEDFKTDGEIFITQHIPAELEERLDKASEQDNNFERTASFPSWFYIIKFILILGAVGFTSGIFQSDVSLAEGYRNAPYIYWITPLLWIALIIMIIFEKSRAKKVYNSEDFSEHMENFIKVIQEAEKYLGIPEDSVNIDILMFRYTEKNGEQKHKNFPLFSHINLNCKIYIKNENLCLSNASYVMEIPLQSLKSIHMEKKKASFPNWNKNESFNSKTYRPFKIVCNNQGNYFAKYYSVKIEDIKGEFEFFVPNYDIDNLCNLTGLDIDEK